MARVVAGWLDMSDNEIEVLLQQKASEVVTQLQAKLSTSMAANMGTFTKKVKSAQTGYDSQAHLDATNAHTKAQQDEL
jgi:hypothetical protein